MRQLVTLAILSLALAGCQLLPTRACTLAGCGNVVVFELAAHLAIDVEYDVEVCLDEFCDRQTLLLTAGPNEVAVEGNLSWDRASSTINLSLPDGTFNGRYRVRLAVRDEDGRIVAETDTETGFRREQPNGRDCPPVCWITFVPV